MSVGDLINMSTQWISGSGSLEFLWYDQTTGIAQSAGPFSTIDSRPASNYYDPVAVEVITERATVNNTPIDLRQWDSGNINYTAATAYWNGGSGSAALRSLGHYNYSMTSNGLATGHDIADFVDDTNLSKLHVSHGPYCE